MGEHVENVEIQPMTAAEIRQYFSEHSKKTHQLAIQLNQLMAQNVSSPHLPQTMPVQLTGPGMVSFSLAAGTIYSVIITSPVTLSLHQNFYWHLKIHMYTWTASPIIF